MLAARSLVLAAAVAVSLAGPAAGQDDHLKCYKVKDPLLLSGTVDLDSPQFGVDPGCKIGRASPPLFCVPATKTVVAVRDRATGQPITPLPVTGPDPGDRLCYKIKCEAPGPAEAEVTDQFGTRTVTGLRAKLLCTPAVKGGPPGPTTTTTTTTPSTTTTTQRFVDNGDGTVTDHQTGLQWEQKVAGSGCLHCVDDTYTWCVDANANFFCDNDGLPDGTAFTSFLSTLNGGATGVGNCVSGDGTTQTGGFAGRCDWRLPTIAELRTILDCSFGSPCIDPIFGPTAASFYWSSTTLAVDVDSAWGVFFGNGFMDFGGKFIDLRVRAVRGGS